MGVEDSLPKVHGKLEPSDSIFHELFEVFLDDLFKNQHKTEMERDNQSKAKRPKKAGVREAQMSIFSGSSKRNWTSSYKTASRNPGCRDKNPQPQTLRSY